MQWLGGDAATSHCLNQWWHSSFTHTTQIPNWFRLKYSCSTYLQLTPAFCQKPVDVDIPTYGWRHLDNFLYRGYPETRVLCSSRSRRTRNQTLHTYPLQNYWDVLLKHSSDQFYQNHQSATLAHYLSLEFYVIKKFEVFCIRSQVFEDISMRQEFRRMSGEGEVGEGCGFSTGVSDEVVEGGRTLVVSLVFRVMPNATCVIYSVISPTDTRG